MKHDILGQVEQSDGHPFDAVATIRYGSRDIKVGISRDDQTEEKRGHPCFLVAYFRAATDHQKILP